jgi:hypothetical protein
LGAGSVPLPFDSVVLTDGGARRRISPAEFLALPLPVRILALLDDSLEFLQDGKPVDRQQALDALRRAWASR